MTVINIAERIEARQHDTWYKKVTTNILKVMNVFKEESTDICAMVEAHGDKDNLESGSIYQGVDEYFCEEPEFITAEGNNIHTDVEDIAVGKYVMILEVWEDIWEEAGPGDTTIEVKFKHGRLTYMKKRVGEPL